MNINSCRFAVTVRWRRRNSNYFPKNLPECVQLFSDGSICLKIHNGLGGVMPSLCPLRLHEAFWLSEWPLGAGERLVANNYRR